MSPLPAQFADRWGDRREVASFEDAVCWHLLVGDQPSVHMTVLLARSMAEITQDNMNEMLGTATQALSGVPPVSVKFGRVLYHPEAIVLDASPASALSPVFEAALAATRAVTGTAAAIPALSWKPHLTLCYSTSEQPAPPVIAALGKELPACEVTIDKLSLVIQHGPEPLWDCRPVGTAGLLGLVLQSGPGPGRAAVGMAVL